MRPPKRRSSWPTRWRANPQVPGTSPRPRRNWLGGRRDWKGSNGRSAFDQAAPAGSKVIPDRALRARPGGSVQPAVHPPAHAPPPRPRPPRSSRRALHAAPRCSSLRPPRGPHRRQRHGRRRAGPPGCPTRRGAAGTAPRYFPLYSPGGPAARPPRASVAVFFFCGTSPASWRGPTARAASGRRRPVWTPPLPRHPGPERHPQRRGKRRPQPARHQLPAGVPRHRARGLGRPHAATAPTSSPTNTSTCRCGGRRCSSKRASTAAQSGWSSSRTTSRCGRRSGSTSAPSCRTCSGRAPSRARSRARPTSSSATRKRPRRTTSTSASSTSSWASRR